MGLFGKILEIGIKTVTLPVDVVKDVVTLGGTLSDKGESYTIDKCEDIMNDVDKLGDDD